MVIRVGIIHDHPVVTLGIAAVLNAQPDMHVTATAATVSELYAFGQPLDVILLALALADGTAPAANVRSLRRGGARILGYAAGDGVAVRREAIEAGAVGIVRISDTPAALTDLIRRAADGESIEPAHGGRTASHRHPNAGLTEREREVLSLYASGKTAARVAEQLFITPETVYDHVRRIRAKYAAVQRTAQTKLDLFHRALEDGVLPREG